MSLERPLKRHYISASIAASLWALRWSSQHKLVMEWRKMSGSRLDFTFAGGDPEKIGTEPAPQVDSAEQQGHKGPYAEAPSRMFVIQWLISVTC